MNTLEAIRVVLYNVVGWSAGALFAVVWTWFFGMRLTSAQAGWTVASLTLIGLAFGSVQALRARRAFERAEREDAISPPSPD